MTPYDPMFDESKVSEVKQLLQKGTYIVVSPSDVPTHATVLNSRFVLSLKRGHVYDLRMRQIVLNPCVFYTKDGGSLSGVQGTLVDGTLSTDSDAFSETEGKASTNFESNPKQNTLPIRFGGVLISSEMNGLTLSQFELSIPGACRRSTRRISRPSSF